MCLSASRLEHCIGALRLDDACSSCALCALERGDSSQASRDHKARPVCVAQFSAKMQKIHIATLFVVLLVLSAHAAPRKALLAAEDRELAASEEHQRILAELEEVHALRDRMLQEGTFVLPICCCSEPSTTYCDALVSPVITCMTSFSCQSVM